MVKVKLVEVKWVKAVVKVMVVVGMVVMVGEVEVKEVEVKVEQLHGTRVAQRTPHREGETPSPCSLGLTSGGSTSLHH